MVSRRKHKVKRRLRTRRAGQVRQSLLNDLVRLKPVQLPSGQAPVIRKADYGLLSKSDRVIADVPPTYPTLSVSQEDTVSTPESSPMYSSPRPRVKVVVPASRKVVPAGRRRGGRHTRKM